MVKTLSRIKGTTTTTRSLVGIHEYEMKISKKITNYMTVIRTNYKKYHIKSL